MIELHNGATLIFSCCGVGTAWLFDEIVNQNAFRACEVTGNVISSGRLFISVHIYIYIYLRE